MAEVEIGHAIFRDAMALHDGWLRVDMPDRTVAGADLVAGAGALAVPFVPPFRGLSGIGVTAQGMASGDIYEISAKTPGGFTIGFRNAAGASVSRTFDYVAKGYGAQT